MLDALLGICQDDDAATFDIGWANRAELAAFGVVGESSFILSVCHRSEVRQRLSRYWVAVPVILRQE